VTAQVYHFEVTLHFLNSHSITTSFSVLLGQRHLFFGLLPCLCTTQSAYDSTLLVLHIIGPGQIYGNLGVSSITGGQVEGGGRGFLGECTLRVRVF
jgi:hypothetical protein